MKWSKFAFGIVIYFVAILVCTAFNAITGQPTLLTVEDRIYCAFIALLTTISLEE